MLRWQAVEALTGKLIADLPNLTVGQDLKLIIGQASTATASLWVRSAPTNWMRATKPYATVLVATQVNEDDPADAGVPVWAGLIVQRQRQVQAAVALSLQTAEGYLARRFIRDTVQYPATSWGRVSAGVDLLQRYVLPQGLPFRINQIGAGIGQDTRIVDTDDKSIASAFDDLGFEYTVTWERQHEPERITPVITLGERIGAAAPSGLGPAVTFDYPGNLSDGQHNDDYSTGKGANDVLATSTGQGSVRPQSAHQVEGNLDDRPLVEFRYSAGTNIVSRAALNNDAQQSMRYLADGTQSVSLVALQSRAPVFGQDWHLGDDIGYDITSPEFPGGLRGVDRAAGVSFTARTVSPILAVLGDSTS